MSERIQHPAVWEEATIDSPFLLAILEHVAHAIFVKDASYRFVLLNEAASALMGFPRDEMLGKTDYDFFPPREADHFREMDAEVFRTRRTVHVAQERITDGAGRAHDLTTTKMPLLDARGNVTHLVGIIHDISPLVQAREALRAANERLEERVLERTEALAEAHETLSRKERLAVLGRLAGSVAHQIRNPLASIANAAYVLRRKLEPTTDPDVQEALHIILDDVRRSNRIITDLIDYARVRPPILLPMTPSQAFDLALAGQAIPDTIAVAKSVPQEDAFFADAAQLEDALSNLVRNSLEAMPQGGALRLSSRLEDDYVVLTVEDTGSGIPAEVRARMFEPLLTTKPMGLGLGLVTARTLVENQGGKIGWASDPTVGTRFEIRLPRLAQTT